MNRGLEFDCPHLKAALHLHIIFYRQLVQWWWIGKFSLTPNTHWSWAGNWHQLAAGRNWSSAASSSLAASEDNSVLLLCHCRVKLQMSAVLFMLLERYRCKSIHSGELKNNQPWKLDSHCCLLTVCIKELQESWVKSPYPAKSVS